MLEWIEIFRRQHDFKLSIPRKKSNQTALKSAHYTIDYIVKNYPKPYFLFLSGGVDSQAMLYAWHTSGIPYETISVKYNSSMNDHDLETLSVFSQQNNLKINYIDFDILKFFKKEYFEYVDQYRCGSPHICTYMKMSEFVSKGTAIFSGSYMDYHYPVFIDKNNWGLYKYALQTKRSIVPYFFMETCELAYSMITKVPISISSSTNFQIFPGAVYGITDSNQTCFYDDNGILRNKFPNNTLNKKSDIYQYNGFPVIGQNYKVTGFEKIKEFYDKIDIHFSPQDKLQRLSHQPSYRKFDILLRNKYEYKYRWDKYEVSFYV